MTVHLMDERFDTGPILAQGSRPMPAGTLDRGLRAGAPVPRGRAASRRARPRARGRQRRAADRARRELRAAFRRGLRRARPCAAPRVELERQVRAWSVMFDRSVTGPIATVGEERFLVRRRDARGSRRSATSRGSRQPTGPPGSSGSSSSDFHRGPFCVTVREPASHVRDAAAAAASRPCDADFEP